MKIPFRKNPAVSITKSAYAMASSDGVSAEITLYGDIYESQPTDWWGDPVEGQFITLTEFLEDLKQMLILMGENAREFTLHYGNVTAASVGAIQRAVAMLEDEGGACFFGTPPVLS